MKQLLFIQFFITMLLITNILAVKENIYIIPKQAALGVKLAELIYVEKSSKLYSNPNTDKELVYETSKIEIASVALSLVDCQLNISFIVSTYVNKFSIVLREKIKEEFGLDIKDNGQIHFQHPILRSQILIKEVQPKVKQGDKDQLTMITAEEAHSLDTVVNIILWTKTLTEEIHINFIISPNLKKNQHKKAFILLSSIILDEKINKAISIDKVLSTTISLTEKSLVRGLYLRKIIHVVSYKDCVNCLISNEDILKSIEKKEAKDKEIQREQDKEKGKRRSFRNSFKAAKRASTGFFDEHLKSIFGQTPLNCLEIIMGEIEKYKGQLTQKAWDVIYNYNKVNKKVCDSNNRIRCYETVDSMEISDRINKLIQLKILQ
jgi:hypothetical protein